jgi:hypothetical protein
LRVPINRIKLMISLTLSGSVLRAIIVAFVDAAVFAIVRKLRLLMRPSHRQHRPVSLPILVVNLALPAHLDDVAGALLHVVVDLRLHESLEGAVHSSLFCTLEIDEIQVAARPDYQEMLLSVESMGLELITLNTSLEPCGDICLDELLDARLLEVLRIKSRCLGEAHQKHIVSNEGEVLTERVHWVLIPEPYHAVHLVTSDRRIRGEAHDCH